jgi:hypothetical protein
MFRRSTSQSQMVVLLALTALKSRWLTASINFNAARFDIGICSSLDGGDALNGNCAIDILNPNNIQDIANPDGVNTGAQTGSFDEVNKGGQDVCGDVDGSGILPVFAFQT